MIQICLVISVVMITHGQMVKGHFALPLQATVSQTNITQRLLINQSKEFFEMDDDSSGMEPETLDVAECTGTVENANFILPISDPGCYIFKTTGFGQEGYANAGIPFFEYLCTYKIQFDQVSTGTVTVNKDGFEFERYVTGDCADYLEIAGIDDEQQQMNGLDTDDENSDDDAIKYCGTINENKNREFSGSAISIILSADAENSYNGAEIRICLN